MRRASRFPVATAFLTLGLACTAAPEGRAAGHHAKKDGAPTIHLPLDEDFSHGLENWRLCVNGENSLNDPGLPTKDRLTLVPAPGMAAGTKALRVDLPRELDSYRSEISLGLGKHENALELGFADHWYAESLFIPEDWQFDQNDEPDIVMQWHAVMGKERVDRDFPPLSIAIKGDRWDIARAFGTPSDIKRDRKTLDAKVEKGKWTRFVVHVKWNSGQDGLVQIWKDGAKVFEAQGPNTYDMKPHTPYFKTGIYHPDWKARNKANFEQEKQVIPKKTLFVAAIKVADREIAR